MFDALTKPELLQRWFGGGRAQLVVCEIDLRVGGAWHFVLRGPSGQMVMRGTYLEIAAPDRLVHSESFDAFPGEAVVTQSLSEREGKTTLTATMRYSSQQIRDAVLKSGMEHGVADSYDRLAAILI